MNIEQLRQLLEKESIPIDSYSLSGGLPNEAFCISNEDDSWEVYYSERGQKSGLLLFKTEKDACENIYKRIVACHLGV